MWKSLFYPTRKTSYHAEARVRAFGMRVGFCGGKISSSVVPWDASGDSSGFNFNHGNFHSCENERRRLSLPTLNNYFRRWSTRRKERFALTYVTRAHINCLKLSFSCYDCIDWIIKNTLLPDLLLHKLNYSVEQLQYLKYGSSEIYSSRSVKIIFIIYLRSCFRTSIRCFYRCFCRHF